MSPPIRFYFDDGRQHRPKQAGREQHCFRGLPELWFAQRPPAPPSAKRALRKPRRSFSV